MKKIKSSDSRQNDYFWIAFVLKCFVTIIQGLEVTHKVNTESWVWLRLIRSNVHL